MREMVKSPEAGGSRQCDCCITGTNGHRPRYVAYTLTIVVVLYLICFRPFNRKTIPIDTHKEPDSYPKIIKVTEELVPKIEVYQASLRSHDQHNRLQGYDMKVFREQAADNAHRKPTSLISIIENKLQNSPKGRKEWLVWTDPDVVLLNPQIPLEIFLPPDDFSHVHFLATRDNNGFSPGVFFIHVHPWSLKMLLNVLKATEANDGQLSPEQRHQRAFSSVLRSDLFRDNVLYQPRNWYNTYPDYTSNMGKEGYLLTNFKVLGGEKWNGMAETLASLASSEKEYSVPLDRTPYEARIQAFWERIREARVLLPYAQPKMEDKAVQNGVRRVQYALTYETDEEKIMKQAIHMLKLAIGVIGAPLDE